MDQNNNKPLPNNVSIDLISCSQDILDLEKKSLNYDQSRNMFYYGKSLDELANEGYVQVPPKTFDKDLGFIDYSN